MLKDIRIKTQSGERLTKVIVLKETKEGIVYIPLNSISRVDYDRFTDMYSRTKDKMDLLKALHEERLDNGRNGLVVYKDVIRHKSYKTNTSNDSGNNQKSADTTIEDPGTAVPESNYEEPQDVKDKIEEQQPKKRGPGRPPKKEQEKKVQNVEFPDED